MEQKNPGRTPLPNLNTDYLSKESLLDLIGLLSCIIVVILERHGTIRVTEQEAQRLESKTFTSILDDAGTLTLVLEDLKDRTIN